MRRATITVPDDLECALDAYIHDQEVPPALTTAVQAALRQYFAERGYLPGEHRLRTLDSRTVDVVGWRRQ